MRRFAQSATDRQTGSQSQTHGTPIRRAIRTGWRADTPG
jgi:hypothetical protein